LAIFSICGFDFVEVGILKFKILAALRHAGTLGRLEEVAAD